MDIKQPAASAPNPSNQPIKSDIVPEVVEGIPVKQPSAPAEQISQTNPLNPQAQPPTSEAEIDQVLNEVSAKVKSDEPKQPSKRRWLGRVFDKQPKDKVQPKPSQTSHKPLVVATLAVIVGLSLMVAAYLALKTDSSFSQSTSQNQQTIRQAGLNSSVTTADVEALGVELQTIENLDGSQNFDPSALSDASLGL